MTQNGSINGKLAAKPLQLLKCRKGNLLKFDKDAYNLLVDLKNLPTPDVPAAKMPSGKHKFLLFNPAHSIPSVTTAPGNSKPRSVPFINPALRQWHDQGRGVNRSEILAPPLLDNKRGRGKIRRLDSYCCGEQKFEATDLIDPKEAVEKTMFKCYSKPNLKPRHKLPSLNLSNVKSRPSLPISVQNKSVVFPERGLEAEVSKENNGRFDFLEATGNKSSAHFLDDVDELDSADGYGDELVHRIETALRKAENALRNDGRWDREETPRLKRENYALRKHFKILNLMLSDLLNYKQYENYSVTMEQEAREAKEKKQKLDADIHDKKLQFYSAEHDSLQNQLERISDPSYLSRLEASCEKLNESVKLRQKALSKLQLQDRLGVYRMIKVAAEGGLEGQKEAADLQESVERFWAQIQDCEEKTDKCCAATKNDEENKRLVQDRFDRLVQTAKSLEISANDLDRQNPAAAQAKLVCAKTMQRQRVSHEGLENAFHVKGRDLYAQSKKLQSQIRDVQTDIERKDARLELERQAIEQLLHQLHRLRDLPSSEGSSNLSRAPGETEIPTEISSPNEEEPVMRKLRFREERAALTIQRLWRQHYHFSAKKEEKEISVPPAAQKEETENFDNSGDCVLLFSKEVNRVETFGDEKNVSPPQGVDQEVQADEES